MYRVIVIDEKSFVEDFLFEEDAIDYAEKLNKMKFRFIAIQDEYENEVLRFEN